MAIRRDLVARSYITRIRQALIDNIDDMADLEDDPLGLPVGLRLDFPSRRDIHAFKIWRQSDGQYMMWAEAEAPYAVDIFNIPLEYVYADLEGHLYDTGLLYEPFGIALDIGGESVDRQAYPGLPAHIRRYWGRSH